MVEVVVDGFVLVEEGVRRSDGLIFTFVFGGRR